jgi:hypothetical protein
VKHDGGVCIVCPLHAAALELLEALEDAVKIGDEWPMTRGYRKQVWDKARAAIAKAKGEQSLEKCEEPEYGGEA